MGLVLIGFIGVAAGTQCLFLSAIPWTRCRDPSSLSDWGFDLREAPSVLSQIVG